MGGGGVSPTRNIRIISLKFFEFIFSIFIRNYSQVFHHRMRGGGQAGSGRWAGKTGRRGETAIRGEGEGV